MRLSEDRIAMLARQVCDRLLDEELVDLEIAETEFARLIEILIATDLRIEDELGDAARYSGASAFPRYGA